MKFQGSKSRTIPIIESKTIPNIPKNAAKIGVDPVAINLPFARNF